MFRDGARRAVITRRRRTALSPTRVVVPLLCAVVVIGASALGASALGLALPVVVTVTVVVALAGAVVAHRTVASMAAGLTLAVVRPYSPGERVRYYAPDLDAVITAEIVRFGVGNTTLGTETGLLLVPNTSLLRGTSLHRP